MGIKYLLLKPYRVVRNRKIKKQMRFFKEERLEVLQHFSETLNKANLVFWLEFGTLLGYYREKDFIQHDYDIDTGTFWDNRDKVFCALTEAGFELVREYHVEDDGGVEHCYRYKHTTIDVFYFRQSGDMLYCNSFMPIKHMSLPIYRNRKCPFRVKRIEVPNVGYKSTVFLGCKVYVPCNCEKYLIAHYGPNYMTPNPNYDWKKDSTNIKLYSYEEKPGYGILKSLYF